MKNKLAPSRTIDQMLITVAIRGFKSSKIRKDLEEADARNDYKEWLRLVADLRRISARDVL